MGSYTKNLFKKSKAARQTAARYTGERLVSCAIIREGKVHHGGHSHYELRRQMGDPNPWEENCTDQSGFYTSSNRFVTRAVAKDIAGLSGQISKASTSMSRELLSSDIYWNR